MLSPHREHCPLLLHETLSTLTPQFRPTPPSPVPEPTVTFEHAQAVPGSQSTSTAVPQPSSLGPPMTPGDIPLPGPNPPLTSKGPWRSPYASLENSPSPTPLALPDPPTPLPPSPPNPLSPTLRTSQTLTTPSEDTMSSGFSIAPFNGDKKNYWTSVWQLNFMFLAEHLKYDMHEKKILFTLNQMKGRYAEEWANMVMERYIMDSTMLTTWDAFKSRLDVKFADVVEKESMYL